MATKDDLRIITGTHVVSKHGNQTEEGVMKYVMDTNIGKVLGGKHIVTSNAPYSLSKSQAYNENGWYQESFAINNSPTVFQSAGSDGSNIRFLYVRNLEVSGGADVLLSLLTTQTWDEAGDVNKDWGTREDWDEVDYTGRYPSYDGRWDEGMYIKIPPGGAVHLRGRNLANLENARVRHTGSSGTVNIEYVLAE